MPTIAPSGPEFLPTSVQGDQSQSSVALLRDGTMLVTWVGGTPGDLNTEIFAQVLNSDGSVLPFGRFHVNTIEAGSQLEPEIAALENGGYAIVYSDGSQSPDDPNGTAIRLMVARPLVIGGVVQLGPYIPIVFDVLVNTTTSGGQSDPAVAGLFGGGFVVVWTDTSAVGQPGNVLSQIHGQMFTAGGARIGGEFVANTTATNSQFDPQVTALSRGNFVVTWTDQSFTAPDNRSEAIRGQVFNIFGERLGPEFLVNSTTNNTQAASSVTALGDGGFLVVWADSSGFSATPFTADDIRAQRFSATGERVGTEITINDQPGASQNFPEVIALRNGGFFVAWENTTTEIGNDLSGTGIRARAFDDNGNATGPSIEVNTTRSGDQFDIDLSLTGDGRVLVSWTDESESGGDTSGLAVRARLFDVIGGGRDLIGIDLDDVLLGSIFNDRLSGLGGNDSLFGGDGGDTLNGGTDDDFLFGGATNADLRDLMFGGDGNDSMDGGAGNDEMHGGNGNDTVIGGLGSDTLIGNDGDDVIVGSGGSDAIFGNAGRDFINGGFGFDRLNGGADADSFFHQGVADHGSDWIQDYNAAEGDRLVVGISGATRSQFQVNFATTAGAGDAGVGEAFVIYRPTGQILFALVDGAGQSSININLGGQVFDLLA